MKDEFINRLGAFQTTVNFLFDPVNNSKWNGQPPLRFAQRTAAAATQVNALAQFCQQQGTVITGPAADKAREEKELEDTAHILGKAVAECCRSLGDEATAHACDFSMTAWREMRDATLLATARTVIQKAQACIANHAAEATECGITAAAVTACTQQADDFQSFITAPQQAIAGKKGLTTQMRDRFNAVEATFTSMDGLIGQFTDRTFVEGYKAARVVRDLGAGPSTPPPPPPPAPPSP